MIAISLDKYLTQNIYQFKEMAIALTFVGGYIDAYTFLERGGTLAAGQTGNLIFLASEVSHHNLDGGLLKIISVISFMIGVMFVSLIHAKIATRYWRLIALLPITMSSIIVGFIPASIPNIYIIPPLAFSMAMLTTALGKIEGEGYANTFSTGNLKKAVIALSEFIINKNKVQLSKSLLYIRIVISFVVGGYYICVTSKIYGSLYNFNSCIHFN